MSNISKRRRLAGEQNWRCCHCGKPMEPEQLTYEHILPKSRGGTYAWDNLAVAHRRCNSARGTTPVEMLA